MGKEQPSSYYDDIFLNEHEFKKHYSQSRYFKLWDAILNEIDGYLTDLGCGVGQFASMFSERHPELVYYGVDFSQTAIEIAKSRNLPNCEFSVMDICYELPSLYENVLLGEVLEHIHCDLDVVKKVSDFGSNVFITVPDFDAPSHIRHFKSENEIYDRYSMFFDTCSIRKIDSWYLMKCICI